MLTDFLCKHVYRSNPSLCPLLHSTKDCYYKVADAYFAVLEAEQRDVFKANPPLCIGVAQDNCWMSDVKASRCSRLKFKCVPKIFSAQDVRKDLELIRMRVVSSDFVLHHWVLDLRSIGGSKVACWKLILKFTRLDTVDGDDVNRFLMLRCQPDWF